MGKQFSMKMHKVNAILRLSFFVPSIVSPSAAFANWQYTQWGMNPDQVVQSSNGALRRSSKMANDGTLIGAEGTYTAGQRQFDATLFFRANGLYQVDLYIKGDLGCKNLLADVSAIYGMPIFSPGRSIDSWYWSDKTKLDKVHLISPGHGFCTLRYTPISSGL